VSAKSTFILLSTETPTGPLQSAAVAVEPSPVFPGEPVPAIVATWPPESVRIAWLPVSAMYTVPDESIAIARGWFRRAVVVAAPSAKPGEAPPATVSMIPLAPI